MKSKITLVVFLPLLVGIGSLAFYIHHHGFSAKEQPSWMEAMLARHARKIATPTAAKGLKNPEPVNESTMAEAREHFVEHCAVCHGLDGRGNTTFGRNMYPKAPDLTDAQTQRLADGELFYIISNGVRFTGMPAFGGEDSPESMWHLVAFLRHLPQLSPEELKQMQELAGEEHAHEAVEEGGQKKGEQNVEEKRRPTADEKPVTPKRRPVKPYTHPPGTKPHEH